MRRRHGDHSCNYLPVGYIQTATTYCSFNGAPIAMKQGLTVTYLHHDQLGSLVSATNSIGGEVFSARYWPFGSLRTRTGTAPSDRLFAGQTRDLGNDAFYHFPARYLDTTIGKFHTPDTIVPDAGALILLCLLLRPLVHELF